MIKRIKFQTIATLMVIAILLLAGTSTALSAANDSVRVWVQYHPGHKADTQALLQRSGAHFHYDFADLESFVVTIPESALKGIANNPFVVDTEEDARRYPVFDHSVMDQFSALMSPQADVIEGEQIVPWGVDAVQARDVWHVATGAGRTVCIIDTGYYEGHVDLPAAIDGYSQVDDDWTRDGVGHGTHVAGTIAALDNGTGVVGVTPGGVSLYIIKIFNDDGDWTRASDLVDAINRCADNGSNVISMSLSGTRANVRERRAFDNLYNQGVLSIAAASNDGGTAYHYPASYDSVVSVAAVDESLTVADFSQKNDQVELSGPGVSVLSTVPFIDETSLTVDGTGYQAYHIEYSARGTASGGLVDGGLCTGTGSWNGQVVLCERGDIDFYDKVMNVQNSGGAAAVIYNNVPGNFYGTLGDGNSSSIVAISLSQEDGQSLVTSQLVASVSSDFTWPASGYQSWDGTSMATPHVSAVAALIWSDNSTWTNVQIREALQATALDLGISGWDNTYGFGLVQAADALEHLNGGAVNEYPIASFAYTTTDLTVTFTDLSTDSDGDIMSWNWEFGDGNTSTNQHPSNTYGVDGTYTVSLTVTDDDGASDTASINVTVSDGSTYDITLSVTAVKIRGTGYADLYWSGATSENVDIYRDWTLFVTTENDGNYYDDTLGKGAGSATYQVCEEGSTNFCSNIVVVDW